MFLVTVLLQVRQKRAERCSSIPDKTKVNLAATAYLFPSEIDLDHCRVLGEELLIGKICA